MAQFLIAITAIGRLIIVFSGTVVLNGVNLLFMLEFCETLLDDWVLLIKVD
ncbi:MAG: hypothetical protein ABSD49_13995 [Candidatus Bathyarchaeia archaeon]